MVYHRRAVDAKRDAGYIFRCARDSRPLELERRLWLGAQAGGLTIRGVLDGPTLERLKAMLVGRPAVLAQVNRARKMRCGPLVAAMVGGHWECVRLLVDCMLREGKSRTWFDGVLVAQGIRSSRDEADDLGDTSSSGSLAGWKGLSLEDVSGMVYGSEGFFDV